MNTVTPGSRALYPLSQNSMPYTAMQLRAKRGFDRGRGEGLAFQEEADMGDELTRAHGFADDGPYTGG